MSDSTLATGTPVVSVHDSRGLAVRILNWNREQDGDPLRLLVSHAYVDDASRITTYRDPRLFAGWKGDSTAPANLHTTPSLAGQVLRRESTDSGGLVTLSDAAGRPVWMMDGRGTVQTVAYDELGRPESGSEQLSGSDDIRISWRSGYGDSGPANDGSQGNNLRGICVARYDDGGLTELNAVALSGTVLSQGRRFLTSAEALPDWPEDETGREALLEADSYDTLVVADARGATLNQTDAKGHVQAWRYDVSGAACHQTVTPAGAEKQPLLADVTWSAAGQVLTETAGNGVTTTYSYDAQTQWLATITTKRSDNATLQALSYGYDFTGNVTLLSDGAVTTGWWHNQLTDGERTFSYDALYQLLLATGRENAGNTGMQYSILPVISDGSQYVNYSRSYRYDDSGNLKTMTHSGAGIYTRTMTIEETSNRSVQQNDGGPQTPDAVAGWFDSNGNLLQLQAGASTTDPLAWDGCNNLQSVTLVSRDTDITQNDREVYQYSGSSRVRKQTRTLANAGSQLWNVAEVRYLPGLELHRSWQESAGEAPPEHPAEELHVVTGQAGRAGIRVLHWEAGKPDDIDNNQVRWSVDDNIGSLSLELDAEGQLISREEYYPFGGTAVWAARSEVEASYKTVRYSGKERDGTGLYYYGHRYYAPWLCRWISTDPAGEVDGLNLFRMVRNNPVTSVDEFGLNDTVPKHTVIYGFSHHRGRVIQAAMNDKKVPVTIDEYNAGLGIMGELDMNDYFRIRTDLLNENPGKFDDNAIKENAKKYSDVDATMKDDETQNMQKAYTKSWWNYLIENKTKVDIQAKINNKIVTTGKIFKKTDYSKLDQFIFKNGEDTAITLQRRRELLTTFAKAQDSDFLKGLATEEQSWLTHTIATAFFRQTSKIGMDWFASFLQEADFRFIKGTYDGDPLTNDELHTNKPWKRNEIRGVGRYRYAEPITYSELRHADRKKYHYKIKFIDI